MKMKRRDWLERVLGGTVGAAVGTKIVNQDVYQWKEFAGEISSTNSLEYQVLKRKYMAGQREHTCYTEQLQVKKLLED